MKYSEDLLMEWIMKIVATGRNLSTWEEEFIDSIGDQLKAKHWLSDKQIDILERIYAEKTPTE